MLSTRALAIACASMFMHFLCRQPGLIGAHDVQTYRLLQNCGRSFQAAMPLVRAAGMLQSQPRL